MIVQRRAIWAGIAFGLCLLTGLGAVVAWKWSRTDSDQWSQIAMAYAARDWSLASDLARTRLRTSPEDIEALRYLARATARLGRDTSANALFARLGSSALQAEDLYLLGLGLDRAGQKEAAEGLWRKALQLQPDHAETIEQLIIRDTAQNRLGEAAHLAERLSRQLGWELRGELDLGALRAEQSDPSGAATVLRQALGRPEAARLDRPMATRYRNLLARTLLQTGRSNEAHDLLRSILIAGPDSQAAWLLSRANLQMGAIPEATTALRDSGSYRADHPLESEPSPFLGEGRCAECHRDVFRAVQASRHASTLVRGQQLTRLPFPAVAIPDPDDPTVSHTIRQQTDQVQFETRVKDQVQRAIVEYAFGSPDHYMSLVGPDDRGVFHVLRLSRYQNGPVSGWVRTTGHAADAGEGRDFLGKPLDSVDGPFQCLFCHATNPRAVLDEAGSESKDRGIGCERCHGPGANHEKAVEVRFPDLAIVDPAQAPAEGRLRLCGQCHSHHQPSPLPRTDPFWIRFQGTTVSWSRCYTDSEGAFDCMTCHNPHHDSDRSEEHYTRRCVSCHSPPAGKAGGAPPGSTMRTHQGRICPVNPAKGCVGCHMPPYESKPLHATFTDHYIRVHPERKGAESRAQ